MTQPQFRPHMQATQQQPNNNRMQCQPRQGPMKPRHNTPSQNIVKRPNQQLQSTAPRNSNLRELPIAPSHAMEMNNNRRTSTPAAQVKPITSTVSAPKAVTGVGNSQGRPEMKAKAITPVGQAKSEVKSEPEYPDEDEETRLYRLKIEEQKRLREEILKQKELRRQQQAGARKRELLERLAQQQQQQQPSTQQSYIQQEDDSSEFPTNGSPYIPHSGLQTRQNVKNRLLVKKPDTVVPNIQPKPADFAQVGANMQYQGQQMKPVKQVRQTRTVPPSQPQAPPKVLQTKPPAAALPATQSEPAAGSAESPADKPSCGGAARDTDCSSGFGTGKAPRTETQREKDCHAADKQ
ncbi:PREDICTED: RNA-binding protein 33-like [Apaloderma vittatum]|uniref:RNA-binding protein 33-like n=1 Tax=Apaloderma vittatum TaxID=57397 RepID=UPI000521501D|nr:PREDICTED: RNA-binding protein 33-like [Apaloderma vittatum]